MVRAGGFSLALRANTDWDGGMVDLPESTIAGRQYVEGTPGSAFEVVVRNSNSGLYKVNLFVDGKDTEPGYSTKLSGDGRCKFRGFMRAGGGIHEFLFSKTPVDGAAGVGARPDTDVGEVRVEIFATQEVKLESDEEGDDGKGIGKNDAAFGAGSALPEALAVKELGVQGLSYGCIARRCPCLTTLPLRQFSTLPLVVNFPSLENRPIRSPLGDFEGVRRRSDAGAARGGWGRARAGRRRHG
jgi:hypothetical protein